MVGTKLRFPGPFRCIPGTHGNVPCNLGFQTKNHRLSSCIEASSVNTEEFPISRTAGWLPFRFRDGYRAAAGRLRTGAVSRGGRFKGVLHDFALPFSCRSRNSEDEPYRYGWRKIETRRCDTVSRASHHARSHTPGRTGSHTLSDFSDRGY